MDYKYKYLFFDGSVILMKIWSIFRSNIFIEIPTKDSKGRLMFDDNGDAILHYQYTFKMEKILEGFYWKLGKFLRDHYQARKVFVVFDWSPYHKINLLPDYKGDRYHYTQDELDTLNFDDDPKRYIEFQEEVRIENLKFQAKDWICNYFGKLGFPILTHQGYEADDWIYLLSEYLKDNEERSAFVSVDSDWTYFVKPNLDWINFNGKVITFDQKKVELDEWVYPELNLNLYQYKSYIDSLYGSHNNLQRTITDSGDANFKDALRDIINGGNQYLTDRDLFDRQLKSFDVDNYPEIDQVKDQLTKLDSVGSIYPLEEYRLFCTLSGMPVTDSYYNRVISSLDHSLYKIENLISGHAV